MKQAEIPEPIPENTPSDNAVILQESPTAEPEEVDDSKKTTKKKIADGKPPKKKRPGRPRKTPLREPRTRNGIVSQPKDENNFIFCLLTYIDLSVCSFPMISAP